MSVSRFITKYMALLVLVTAAVAFFFPVGFSMISTSWISPLLGIVMLGMGMTIQPADFKIVFTHPKDIMVGVVAQFLIMPSLAWVLVKLFSLPSELALGVILVGACPGGTASNVITYLSHGDLPLSVGMTAVSTLLSPVMTPLIVWLLAGKMVDVNLLSMFLSISEVVLLPILLGMLLRHYFHRLTDRVSTYLPAVSSLCIMLIVGSIVSANSSGLHQAGLLIILVVILHNTLGFLLGYGMGRLLGMNPSKRTAISIEVGMQNSGLACSLATQHFAAFQMATIPGAVFSVWHNIAGAMMAHLFKKINSR